MSQQQSLKSAQKPATDLDRQRWIFNEAKGAHETAKQVLSLLEPTAEGGEAADPLQEIKDLLGQIVAALSTQAQQIASLEAHVVAIREGRGRFGKHAGWQP